MTKLWIDNNMVIRWHEKWPDLKEHLYCVDRGQNSYEQALAQAKAESVPFEDQSQMQRIILKLVDWTPEHVLHSLWPDVRFKPDTFVEIEGEVEVVYQRDFSSTYKAVRFEDVTKEAFEQYHRPYAQRKVARLKPTSSAMSFTEGSELPSAPFPQNPQVSAVQGPWSHHDGMDVSVGWQPGDPPDSIFTREDVRAMVEQARAEALKDIRARILEEFNNITNADNPYQALEWTLDRLGIK